MAPVQADFFNGLSSRPHRVSLHVREGHLCLNAQGLQHELPLAVVQWSERTRHGARSAELPGLGTLQACDTAQWDAFVQMHARADSLVVRAQQSWRGVLVSLVLLGLSIAGLYVWGLPLLARAVVPLIPASVDAAVGQAALERIDGHLLLPSRLPADTRQRLRERFMRHVQTRPGMPVPRLEFRASRMGPNALALPGGTVILTDELVQWAADEDMVMGVLGHEWGHVQHRHGMRQLVQVSALQAGLSVAMGDYAGFLTTAPLVVAAMGYSREHEREADESSVRFMRAAGISPAVMAGFFEKLNARRHPQPDERPVGISILSSHPDDAERIAFFRRAAAR